MIDSILPIDLVIPELKRKFVPLVVHALTGVFYVWSISMVVILYSIYYDHESSWWNEFASGIQLIIFTVSICTLIMWTRVWLKRQNDDRWELDLEEFTFLFFLIPTILYAPDSAIWGLAVDINHYKNRDEADLIFLIGSHLTFAMVLIGKYIDYKLLSRKGFFSEIYFYSGPWSHYSHAGSFKYEIVEFETDDCAIHLS